VSAKYPGWYRTIEVDCAAQRYGFPEGPKRGDEYTAWDGSGWAFDVLGSGFWECMSYANICMCCGVELAVPSDEFCPACISADCVRQVRRMARS
jgi:hypothetical protein